MNLQQAQLSVEGKAANAKVQALTQKAGRDRGQDQGAARSQQKLQTGGSVMNEQARGALEKEIDRQTRELERLQQDAQADLNEPSRSCRANSEEDVSVLQQLDREGAAPPAQRPERDGDLGRRWTRPDARGGEEAGRRRQA